MNPRSQVYHFAVAIATAMSGDRDVIYFVSGDALNVLVQMRAESKGWKHSPGEGWRKIGWIGLQEF